MSTPVLHVEHITMQFGGVVAVNDLSMDIYPGEIVALIGPNGAGKTTAFNCITGVYEPTNGRVDFMGEPIVCNHPRGKMKKSYAGAESERYLSLPTVSYTPDKITKRGIARTFQNIRLFKSMTVFENVLTAMHVRRTSNVFSATFRANHKEEAAQREKALELLEEVGITDAEKRMKSYPHQLSGGMRQRVVIAIALSCDPDLLICDEPTTALDVTIQAKILELIRSIQKERGISVIYITHDLGVVAKVADYVDVMYAGKIVETGTIDEIFYDPRHPYTWGLLSAMPDLDTADERLYTIPGSPPNLLHEKAGDAFAPRNKYALEIDDEIDPPMFKISDTHFAATWLLDPRAPKVEMPPELKDRVARMSAEAKKIEEAE